MRMVLARSSMYCSLSYPRSRQIALVPTDEIQMLGVPLGCDEKAAAYVESKLFGKLSSIIDRLAEFDDMQSAFFLLRVSFTIVRATHFMRNSFVKMEAPGREIRRADSICC